ncbi:DUF6934 family protein [Dyadobacter sp. CY347]|uniref:DUF6934 family protein n=1 Tax=Dyadobacter sp. CY347 TaxID=2909336 RepID=UPI001F1B1A5D|nr:hypothetical protein [Dyadobacter sp. CY347]MCF2488370.1 hypothetical protein [Dyadobacter sp. CY347]
MQEAFYPFTLQDREVRYEFISRSPEKEVTKVVLLTATDNVQVYNLALLDLLKDGSLCDIVETKNKDFKIVLATVFRIIIHFLEAKPSHYVVFSGSDPRRHRLYRMVLSRELAGISKTFRVLGISDGIFEEFRLNTNYRYYLIGNYEREKQTGNYKSS